MEQLSRVFNAARAVLVVLAVALVAAVALAGCGSSSGGGEEVSFTGSGHPNGDLSNTRYERGPINSGNVANLQVAWKLPITGVSSFGSYASAPIISKGVMYSQDLASNVQAIEVETGKVLWTASFEQPDHGPNGVVVENGLVYGVTPTEAFALDQKTG